MSWFVFFFSSRRRHTRYIGDWSSDVCSSDLERGARFEVARPEELLRPHVHVVEIAHVAARIGESELHRLDLQRSEERRVGKECRCGGGRERDRENERIEEYGGASECVRWRAT